MTVPVSSGGVFARDMSLTVPITGHDAVGVAVCDQVRSFDLDALQRAGSARFVETLDMSIVEEIVSRVLSVIDPAS